MSRVADKTPSRKRTLLVASSGDKFFKCADGNLILHFDFRGMYNHALPAISKSATEGEIMTEKFSQLPRVLFIAACLALLCGRASAQKQNVATGKSQVSTSCDGALDIVPSKAMTFARKRRATNTSKPAPTDAKPDKKQPGAEKQGR